MVKSKKRLICLAVVLLILATSLVGLVGCKSKNENIIEIELICVSDNELAFDMTLKKHSTIIAYFLGINNSFIDYIDIGLYDEYGKKDDPFYDIFNKNGEKINKLEFNANFMYKGDKARIIFIAQKFSNILFKKSRLVFYTQTKDQFDAYFELEKNLIEEKYKGVRPEEITVEEKALLEKSFKELSYRHEIIIPNKDM